MTARKVQKKPIEATEGRYSAIPDSLLDSVAYQGCSFSAKALLLELARQHSRANNGHIQAVYEYLKRRGWRSKATLAKSLAELLERGLIVKTRQGGFNMGACRYALTWLSISNFVGLDITATTYHKGAYLLLNPLPKIKLVSTDFGTVKPVTSTDSERVRKATYPETVLVDNTFNAPTYPETVHNGYYQYHAPELNDPDVAKTPHDPHEFAYWAALNSEIVSTQFIKSVTVGAITWH